MSMWPLALQMLTGQSTASSAVADSPLKLPSTVCRTMWTAGFLGRAPGWYFQAALVAAGGWVLRI